MGTFDGPERATHDGRPLLLWRLDAPVTVAASTVLGGGVGTRRWIVNAEVGLEYHDEPVGHLRRIAAGLGLDPADGVGLLTAASVVDVVVTEDGGASCAATVGVTMPTWAAAPDGDWSEWRPGTINLVCHVPTVLSPGALVNAVATVTEAKAQALLEAGVPGTGTASDAVVVCCPVGDGGESYGGPRSQWGARLARAAHAAGREGVGAMTPAAGEHGGDGARLAVALGVATDEVLDLSASLNPCAPDVTAIAARHLDALRRYPDDMAATEAMATALGVDAARVVMTNGGAEAIALVAGELEVGEVVAPEFSLYERHLATGPGRWRSNPNNPTGVLAADGDEAAVWDEAFWPLASGTWTRGDADRGAVVLGSLTKVFAAPGLRAGFVLAPSAGFAARVRARRPEWSLNGLAAALVPELVAGADLAGWAKAIDTLRGDLVGLLRDAGHAVDAADAPWVLVPDAGDLRDELARHAILVRDCASFGMAGTVRVAIPDERGLERLAGALRYR